MRIKIPQGLLLFLPVVLCVVSYLSIYPMFKFSGTRPTLGVKDLKLTPCPSSPNCVCTTNTDAEHGIAPLAFSGSQPAAMAALKGVIQAMERAAIVVESPDYLHVEFTSKLMGYVDDVEFYFAANSQTIQVRSASRLGKSDLGVNRKRVEDIRQRLQAAGV